MLFYCHISAVSASISLHAGFVVPDTGIYRVIRNDCRGFNNLSYAIPFRKQYMYFLFNRTTIQVFVTYLRGDLYVHPL